MQQPGSGGSMSSKVRVYEVAKQLNLDPKQVVGLFQAIGVADVRNHMSSVEPEAVERVKRHLEKQRTHDVVEERVRSDGRVVKRRAIAKSSPTSAEPSSARCPPRLRPCARWTTSRAWLTTTTGTRQPRSLRAKRAVGFPFPKSAAAPARSSRRCRATASARAPCLRPSRWSVSRSRCSPSLLRPSELPTTPWPPRPPRPKWPRRCCLRRLRSRSWRRPLLLLLPPSLRPRPPSRSRRRW